MRVNLSKKQIKIILTVFISLLIFFIVYVFIINKNTSKKINDNQSGVFVPAFLGEAEKARLNIRPENKVQVIKRNEEGKVILYKVIRNDSDIITDLKQIQPVVSITK